MCADGRASRARPCGDRTFIRFLRHPASCAYILPVSVSYYRDHMRKRIFFTEIGNMFGHVIDAIAYAVVNGRIAKFVVRTLLLGGVATLTLGPITALIYYYFTGNPLDAISIPIGAALIALAFLAFLIDRAVARYQRPEIFVEPVSSFFAPDQRPRDDTDPKYIDGNGFSITAHLRVKAGTTDLHLIKAELYGYSGGLSLLATTQSYRLWSEEILPVNAGSIGDRRSICRSHRFDGNYHFQPAIDIPANNFIELSVTRHFYGPFQDEGAPIDFGNAQLQLCLCYDADGTTSEADFFFSSRYQVNGLTTISALGSVPYFSDREITYWYQKNAINREERDNLLNIEQEVRRHIIKSDDPEDDIFNRWRNKGVTYSSITLLKDLSRRYIELPDFDPKAIWATPHGRVGKWLIRRLTSNK